MVKNYDDMLSRFHTILACHGQTDRIAISISRVSVLTRDKDRDNTMTIRPTYNIPITDILIFITEFSQNKIINKQKN